MVRCKVLTKGKEIIYSRIAKKNHKCHECNCLIAKGTLYIEDHINYAKRTVNGRGYKKWYNNKICLLCWKGEIP